MPAAVRCQHDSAAGPEAADAFSEGRFRISNPSCPHGLSAKRRVENLLWTGIGAEGMLCPCISAVGPVGRLRGDPADGVVQARRLT